MIAPTGAVVNPLDMGPSPRTMARGATVGAFERRQGFEQPATRNAHGPRYRARERPILSAFSDRFLGQD